MCVRNHRGLDYSTNDCEYPRCCVCLCICRCLIMNHLKSPSLKTHEWWSLTNVLSQCLSLWKVSLGLHPFVWKTCFQNHILSNKQNLAAPQGYNYVIQGIPYSFVSSMVHLQRMTTFENILYPLSLQNLNHPNLTHSLPHVSCFWEVFFKNIFRSR